MLPHSLHSASSMKRNVNFGTRHLPIYPLCLALPIPLWWLRIPAHACHQAQQQPAALFLDGGAFEKNML